MMRMRWWVPALGVAAASCALIPATAPAAKKKAVTGQTCVLVNPMAGAAQIVLDQYLDSGKPAYAMTRVPIPNWDPRPGNAWSSGIMATLTVYDGLPVGGATVGLSAIAKSGRHYIMRLTGSIGHADYPVRSSDMIASVDLPVAEFDARFAGDDVGTVALIEIARDGSELVLQSNSLDLAEYRKRVITANGMRAAMAAKLADTAAPCVNRAAPGEKVTLTYDCARVWKSDNGSFAASLTALNWRRPVGDTMSFELRRSLDHRTVGPFAATPASWNDQPSLFVVITNPAAPAPWEADRIGLRIGDTESVGALNPVGFSYAYWTPALVGTAPLSVDLYHGQAVVRRIDVPAGLFKQVVAEMAAGYAGVVDASRAPEGRCALNREEEDSSSWIVIT